MIIAITPDELINQLADTLAELDIKQLCEVADSILSATHTPTEDKEHIIQKWVD